MGNYDSAFYYNNLYSRINDSIEKVVATSSLAISKAKLNDETSRYNIQNLNRERRTQLLQRNIIILSIVVLSILALLVINRKRLQSKLKMELMEQEVVSAKEQLKMFTQNLVEKTNLIEKLESQAQGKQASSDQQAIISELSRQTILTEEDWLKFKSLFEKIHPGFFINLQERVTDITLAELRMAALSRLHLSTNQIASILGISANSVYKTKQRLRQRLNIEAEVTIEEAIAEM
jgi:DNA-binding CsgD family transcriptional regulator